jgi:hypothetical protein
LPPASEVTMSGEPLCAAKLAPEVMPGAV